MRRFKKFKLSVALLASSLTAYSPVTIAAMNAEQKTALNTTIRDTFKGTYNDFYQTYGAMFDATTQTNMTKWLKEFGNTKLPVVQAQVIKDKKGKEAIKLVLNDGGQTLVITMDPNNRNFVDLNGTKVDVNEMMDIPALARKMAKNDQNLNAMMDDINKTDRAPASANQAVTVGYQQFERMTALQRVEYMSLLRLAGEAAQKVTELEATKETKTSSHFMLHPLLAAQLAFAEVKSGTKCVVAGNLSIYEKTAGRMACNPFTPEMAWANSQCNGASKGKLAACNPLVYGYRDDGNAHCLDTGNVADFTKKATQDCGGPAISPLPGTEGSPERIKAYRKIAESYARSKGREASTVAACFNTDNLIKDSGECRNMFTAHEKGFRELIANAEAVCSGVDKSIKKNEKTPDQELACKELLERKLFLNYFSMTTPAPTVPAPTDPDAANKKACADVGGSYGYDRESRMYVCTCKDGAFATPTKDGKFTCPEHNPVPVVTVTAEKESFCQKNKWVCLTPLFLLGGVLLWKWMKPGKSNPTPVPTPIPPIPCTFACVPYVPPTEGTSTTSTGSTNNGGVRPQPQPKPTGTK